MIRQYAVAETSTGRYLQSKSSLWGPGHSARLFKRKSDALNSLRKREINESTVTIMPIQSLPIANTMVGYTFVDNSSSTKDEVRDMLNYLPEDAILAIGIDKISLLSAIDAVYESGNYSYSTYERDVDKGYVEETY